jgi:hypothetical protein
MTRPVRTLRSLAWASLLLLVACAPTVTDRPAPEDADAMMLAVVAGPRERPLDGLAPAPADAMRRAGYGGRFAPRIIDTIAEYRELAADRALATSAELARIARADAALYVAVDDLDRRVDLLGDGSYRRVSVLLQLRVTLVDPATGAALWSLSDLPLTAERVEREELPLPLISDDPLALDLRDRALARLAPEIVARLAAEFARP